MKKTEYFQTNRDREGKTKKKLWSMIGEDISMFTDD